MNPIIYKGQKVITTDLLAMAYETDAHNIHKNYSANEGRFIAGKHYYYLEGQELQTLKSYITESGVALISKFAHHLYLWTERGANRHCKILDTDKAWEQFDNLEETYFRVKQNHLLVRCEVKYLNGVANYIRIHRSIMKDQGSTPKEIAEMAREVCTIYNTPLPINYIKTHPYEQLSLPFVMQE